MPIHRRAGLFFLAAVLCLAPVCEGIGGVDPDPETESDVYTTLPYAKPCVRLLHKDGVIGCASPADGTHGTLYLISSPSDFDTLRRSPPSYSVALVVSSVTLLNASLLADLSRSVDIAGAMLLRAERPQEGYSPVGKFPQRELDLHGRANASYVWNPVGSEDAFVALPFPLVALSGPESDLVKQRAAENREREAEGKHPVYGASFKYRMFAHTDSLTCLNKATCMPVGGYSVWGALREVNETDRVVMAVARMDAVGGLFHDLSFGAESTVSGIVTLLAAAHALANAPNATALPKPPVFALFTGESWAYVGSRKFLHDLQHFQCKKWADEEHTACEDPFAPSLAFTRLSLNRTDAVIEASMLALTNQTVYVHREHDGNPATTALVEAIRQAAHGLPVTIETLSPEQTPGLPPSSLQSFVKTRPSIAAALLSDHADKYRTLYYQSHLDEAAALSSSPDVPSRLCAAATLLARSLWLAAGGEGEGAESVTADCEWARELWHCLAEDAACELLRRYGYRARQTTPASPPSHYSSVYQLAHRGYIGGLARAYYRILGELGRNATNSSASFAFYHDAVDPVLSFDFDAKEWRITGNLSETPLWTESNWSNDLATRVYRMETPFVENLMLGLGCSVIVGGAGVLYLLLRYCKPRYKNY